MEAKVLVDNLIEKGLTIGSCESLTGGLFASTLTSVSGVSKIFKGSIVSYSTLVKENLLGISHKLVETDGVVSSRCAYEMAKSSLKILDVDVAISFTGNAGPDTIEGKEKGLVYIGVAYKKTIIVKEYHFDGNRDEIRKKCVDAGMDLIISILD